ncbi:hypothetical protein Dsin_030285 [Dipteronia sinensis]|uniref:ATP-dependent RNA helicase Ski2/MTR4 C-terminal domain-containing protein n=1 Tax=Dipteronia sinensis TaxID=43782 RepID=A0AAD9ZKS7_9ROSI|nr:hypothetical protein Dsin_030285 [Dipteronia sinensis]
MVDDKMEPSTGKMMLKGSADGLNRFVCIECTRTDEKSPSFSTEDQVTWGVIEFERVKTVIEGWKSFLFVIISLSSACLPMPKDILPVQTRENMLKSTSEFLIRSGSYQKAVRRIEASENLFDKHEIAKSPLIEQKLKVLHMKQELSAKIKSIKRQVRYVTSDDVVELKGKVACEISSAEELTLTELMFNGVLKDLMVEELVSLLSCFVWQENLKDAAKPRDELELLFTQLQDAARRVAKAQLEAKVQIEVESFMNSFRPDIMEAAYAWAKGSKFYEIMEITQVFEGSLIRAIRRLEEVLQQHSPLEKQSSSQNSKMLFPRLRDIVFAASLYV